MGGFYHTYMGVSENRLNPIVPNGFADHYPVFKWLFHWEYTQHFQTNPYTLITPIAPPSIQSSSVRIRWCNSHSWLVKSVYSSCFNTVASIWWNLQFLRSSPKKHRQKDVSELNDLIILISFPSFQLQKILFPIFSLCKIHFSTPNPNRPLFGPTGTSVVLLDAARPPRSSASSSSPGAGAAVGLLNQLITGAILQYVEYYGILRIWKGIYM